MSSATKLELGNSEAPGRSLIYNKIRRGPRIEPCRILNRRYKKMESKLFFNTLMLFCLKMIQTILGGSSDTIIFQFS